MDEGEWQLLSAIARRFYLEDASKIELAAEFDISRFRVARLLQQARELGVVTIEIHDRDETREGLTFRSDPSIEAALSRYADLALAVVAVGSWDPPITQLGPLLTPAERAELEREGVVAEIAGIFLRGDGSVIETDLSRRRISVSADELGRQPRRVRRRDRGRG